MFLSFDPLTLLAIIFAAFFIPGSLLSFSIFRKEDFLFIEKAFIGFAIALVAIPAVPFLLYLVAGIKYTYDIALLSVGLFYLLSIAAFVFFGTYKDILGFLRENKLMALFKERKKLIVPVLLIVLLFVSFWIRFGSYSPVFQELDPYYYTYVAQQLIVFGENPLDDQTGWYPVLKVDHREVPELSYLEAVWYSLYNGSNEYDNMLLAVIASIYPPIAAMLAVFFLYLLMGSVYKREYGIIGAGIAAFAPIFIQKLMAGEQEVQPYAFFALAFFYAMYALMLLKKDIKFAALSGIAFCAVCLGSSSEVVATGTLMVFSFIYGLLLYVRENDSEALKEILKLNSIVFVIGILLGSAVLKGMFYDGRILMLSLIPAVVIVAFFGLLILLKERAKQYSPKLVAGAIIIAGMLFLISPLGEPLRNIGAAGFGLAEYRSALYRTIAEQGVTGDFLHTYIGFAAASYKTVGTSIFEPVNTILVMVLTPLAGAESAATFTSPLNSLGSLLGDVMTIVFIPVTVSINLLFAFGVMLSNAFLGTSVEYVGKENTLLFLWVLLFIFAFIYSASRSKGRKISIPLFFAALILPPFLVGVIKAKYTIYTAFLLGGALAFTLGEAEDFIRNYKGAGKEGKRLKLSLSEEKRNKYAGYVMIFGFVLLFFQFVHYVAPPYTPALVINGFSPRYQDDPFAVQEKLKNICTETGDSTVCSAAFDPMGYADKGTNNQYDFKLCMLSVLSNYSYYYGYPNYGKDEFDTLVMGRCHRISSYWVDSMEWIRYKTEDDSRTTSWWDYGHWINYFGQKDTVLRNEHASHDMIQHVAFAYIDGTPEDLKELMKDYDSDYALFDIELLLSGNQFGGKYGALNYLSCNYLNETNVSFDPGGSRCELEHLWEIIYVPANPAGRTCTISEHQNKTGTIAYKMYYGSPKAGGIYTPYYNGNCIEPIEDARTRMWCENNLIAEPIYCVGDVMLADGSTMTGTYYLNETYPSGDLKLNKAIPLSSFGMGGTYHFGDVFGVTLIYTKDRVWLENGEVTDGYGDRKGKFYDSNLYNAIIVGEIPGFTKVFDNQAVKIYKLEE